MNNAATPPDNAETNIDEDQQEHEQTNQPPDYHDNETGDHTNNSSVVTENNNTKSKAENHTDTPQTDPLIPTHELDQRHTINNDSNIGNHTANNSSTTQNSDQISTAINIEIDEYRQLLENNNNELQNEMRLTHSYLNNNRTSNISEKQIIEQEIQSDNASNSTHAQTIKLLKKLESQKNADPLQADLIREMSQRHKTMLLSTHERRHTVWQVVGQRAVLNESTQPNTTEGNPHMAPAPQ